MLTFTGRQFWPLDPRDGDIAIEDIAQGLANTGRYNGQTRHYFSVAQHSAELAAWFIARRDVPMARWALLHDAQEAYVGDIIRPLKPSLAGFAAIEAGVERLVWRTFGLGEELPAAVKTADTHILGDEMIALFPPDALARHGLDRRPRLGLDIRPLFPTQARDRFMKLFGELFP